MSDLVIVPAWRRPAFLEAALRCLARADTGEQTYWIALDRGHERRVSQIATAFAQRMGKGRVRLRPRIHSFKGNSFNVLNSYKEALDQGADLIHLVEEDVFVGVDYFEFHRSAHALVPDAFAVSACRNQNYADDPTPTRGAVYLAPQYQSIGVSFRPAVLRGVIPHINRAYFRDMIAYCRHHFPNTRINPANAEQDGLLDRMCEAQGGRVAYAARPRAYHAGFVGYHRNGATLRGTIEQQADQLLAMDTAAMNAAAHSFPDHAVVDLSARMGGVSHVIEWP